MIGYSTFYHMYHMYLVYVCVCIYICISMKPSPHQDDDHIHHSSKGPWDFGNPCLQLLFPLPAIPMQPLFPLWLLCTGLHFLEFCMNGIVTYKLYSVSGFFDLAQLF